MFNWFEKACDNSGPIFKLILFGRCPFSSKLFIKDVSAADNSITRFTVCSDSFLIVVHPEKDGLCRLRWHYSSIVPTSWFPRKGHICLLAITCVYCQKQSYQYISYYECLTSFPSDHGKRLPKWWLWTEDRPYFEVVPNYSNFYEKEFLHGWT